MSGADPHRLVFITSTEIEADLGQRAKTRNGTGYFITRSLVLTAFHVVASDRDTVISVRVEQGEPAWRTGCRVVWKDEILDAALIEAGPPLPEHLSPIAWDETLPANNVTWTSTAYPRAAIREEGHARDYKTAGLQGRLYVTGGAGQGRRELDLGVDDKPEVEDWKGASGAPVFVGDALVGLIKSTGWDGHRFHGTPATALRQNAAFRLETEPSWLDLPAAGDWVLALRSETGTGNFVELISASLQRHGKSITKAGKRLAAHAVVEVCINDALETPGRWLKLVEALCVAPLMVADVTGFEPGIMLSLGVRAVVRRGVTVASTGGGLNDTTLATLPFNIQEAKLISHGKSSENPVSRDSRHPLNTIAKTLLSGILEQQSNPHYLDLPAYEAVRCPHPDVAAGGLDPWESILALCSFHKEYAQHWRNLREALMLEYSDRAVVRMRDIDSPRLVGQALYEQIRWTKLCVVDWTHWRPNVFFEFGVRLGCSRLEPISLLEDDGATPDLSQKQKLVSLFEPTRYLANDLRPAVKAALAAHADEQRMVNDLGKPGPRAERRVPYNGTYNVSLAKFDFRQERATLPPHDFLRLSNEATLGKDRQRTGDRPVLFADNTGFSADLARSARERWIAAWLYLRNRHSDQALRADPALFSELKRLGESLLQELKDVSDDPFVAELRRKVLELIDPDDDPASEGC